MGAILRGWLARYNTVHPWLPLGTLTANILGGLLIGMALAVSDRLHPQLKFFITTGFLGGLTTFSTFSAETFTLLNQGRIIAGLSLILLHISLTLIATAVGFFVIKQILVN